MITTEHIKKQYASQPVLTDVNFSMAAHQTASILGKSGCGKSTFLKIIAGLETPDGGRLLLDGKEITGTKPASRNIVYLFQEALLFPHLNVFENLAFGLRIRRTKAADVEKAVREMAESLALEEHLRKMPGQLSGGQNQRVAFGRALIIRPPLILLDEPFSSLDVETRSSMQVLYKKVAREFQLTAIFVTHDLKEALIMGDLMCYMQNGMLETYPTKEAFMHDQKTGVQQEIGFWNDLI